MSTKALLKDLNDLVEELKATSSSNDKIAILKKHLVTDYHSQDLKRLIQYVYHPTYQFFVTSENLLKKSKLTGSSYNDIFDLLDDLKARKITGHDAIGAINTFVSKFPSYQDLIHCIIDKDLKTRAGDKIINKVIPDLIPMFEVALADKYDTKNVTWEDGWYVSRKIDGVRCIAIVDEHGNTSFFSRTGKPFHTLDVIAGGIKALGITSVVFDGELCLVDDEGNEDFQGVMKELRKKDHTIPNPSYKLFDVLDHYEFYTQKGKSSNPFGKRLKKLQEIMTKNSCDCLSVLAQDRVKDDDHFQEWIKKSKAYGYEGLMIRADEPYKGKRSKDLLKFKEFHDAEYKVVEVEMGPFRYIKSGAECEDEMLSSVTIEHKGHKVRVGSGFNIEQRQYFYQNPQEILSKIIRVNYFEETKNQNGTISLRFPTLAYIYGDQRDI